LHARAVAYSDVGREREQNEDAHLVDDDLGLYVVSDGMGGHAAGEVASATAVTAVGRVIRSAQAQVEQARRGELDAEQLRALVEQAVQAASSEVYQLACTNRARSGMGCTLSMLLVAGARAVLAHVGDSRIYLVREGHASQLSVDHTLGQELVRAGHVSSTQAKEHPYAHVLTRSVGTQPAVQVDTLVFDVLPGDRFVLCSDGLSNYIESLEWLARQLGQQDFEASAEELVSYANQAGGKDNITAVVVRIDAKAPGAPDFELLRHGVQSKLTAFASVFLVEDLPLELRARVLQYCKTVAYQPSELVVAQGGECRTLFVVTEGQFALIRGGQQLSVLGPGEFAGLTTLLQPRPARASLQAVQAGKLLYLERDAFWRLVRSRPWLGVALLERLGRRLSGLLDGVIAKCDGVVPPELPGEQL
jgi:serine/threonine protein phosphatase PrpC